MFTELILGRGHPDIHFCLDRLLQLLRRAQWGMQDVTYTSLVYRSMSTASGLSRSRILSAAQFYASKAWALILIWLHASRCDRDVVTLFILSGDNVIKVGVLLSLSRRAFDEVFDVASGGVVRSEPRQRVTPLRGRRLFTAGSGSGQLAGEFVFWS